MNRLISPSIIPDRKSFLPPRPNSSKIAQNRFADSSNTLSILQRIYRLMPMTLYRLDWLMHDTCSSVELRIWGNEGICGMATSCGILGQPTRKCLRTRRTRFTFWPEETLDENDHDPAHRNPLSPQILFCRWGQPPFRNRPWRVGSQLVIPRGFRPDFARGSSTGYLSVMQVRFAGPQGRGPLARRHSAIIGVDNIDFLHCKCTQRHQHVALRRRRRTARIGYDTPELDLADDPGTRGAVLTPPRRS
jgi:hypothetical protein